MNSGRRGVVIGMARHLFLVQPLVKKSAPQIA